MVTAMFFFFSSSCVVQDQYTGKVIAKGPKCGHLFPLRIPTQNPNMSLFASTVVSNNNVQLWHIINRPPSPKLQNKSPHFRLFQTEPQYTHLHTFGCVRFVHLPTHERSKLSAQSTKCAFLGYASQQKGFICYDTTSKHIRISRNVVLFEHQYLFQSYPDSSPEIICSKVPSVDDECLPSPLRFHPDKVYARRQGTNAFCKNRLRTLL